MKPFNRNENLRLLNMRTGHSPTRGGFARTAGEPFFVYLIDGAQLLSMIQVQGPGSRCPGGFPSLTQRGWTCIDGRYRYFKNYKIAEREKSTPIYNGCSGLHMEFWGSNTRKREGVNLLYAACKQTYCYPVRGMNECAS